LTPTQANNHGAMIPKYPLEKGKRDETGEAVDVRKTFNFCHANIVTEIRVSASSIFSGFFQVIRALKSKNYPLKSTMSH
jgi:hypothetical protein